MSEELTVFSGKELKGCVQNMRDLLSQKNLTFLLGAGCSTCAGLPLMSSLTEKVINHEALSGQSKKLIDTICKNFDGSAHVNIENYMSEIVDLHAIVERRTTTGAINPEIALEGEKYIAHDFQTALNEIKTAIVSAVIDQEVTVATHQRFVKAIHGSLQAGKSTRSVDYYVLNYDTLIEDALGLEQIPYSDGFAGATTGWWDPAVFSIENVNARVFKVHGSIDWCLLSDDTLPRRIRSGITTASERKHILIYPSASKYQEAQRDPFAQILQHMRDSLSPNVNQEMILVVCGYSLGDSHINYEIESALYKSKGRLTLLVFISTDLPEGTLKAWLEDPKITEQIQVYSNKSYVHGKAITAFEDDLSWWKFEIITKLLGGEQ